MRLLAIAGGGAVVVAAAVAFWLTMSGNMAGTRTGPAEWPPAERAAFMRSCQQECQNSPGVTPEKYPLCERACTCAADEAEKTMNMAQLSDAAQAVGSGKASPEQTALLERLKSAGARCAAGSPPIQK